MRSVILTVVGVGVAVAAQADMYGGVEFPDGAASFADAVVAYSPGPNTVGSHADPAEALGIPDYPGGSGVDYVSLGWGGSIILAFTDNSLTTSGDSALDLWIFEVGGVTEGTAVAISTNGLDWISVGNVLGQPDGIDIDAYTPAGVVLWERYSYVRVTDLDTRGSGSPFAGADIDAVGAISSAPPRDDIVPEPATSALFALGVGGLVLRRRLLGRSA